MSKLSDILGFEGFNFKDMLKQIKQHPGRLLFGVDPFATKLENTLTGSKFTPVLDQMGGPYGGSTISAFGNQDGGVYKRAQDAGINTNAGGTAHDVAHVVSALIAGNYGLGKLPQGTQSNQFSQFQMPQQQQDQSQQGPDLFQNYRDAIEKQRIAQALLQQKQLAAQQQQLAQPTGLLKFGKV